MYTCPMHPEVRSEASGRCPKCGMALVMVGAGDHAPGAVPPAPDRGLGPITWRSYLPLAIIIGLILLASIALSWRDYGVGQFSFVQAVAYFMTGFFLAFSGFKLLDLKGFVHGYSTYDLLAQRFSAYAHFYPFLELGFGLAMLAGIRLPWLLWMEVAVMGFSGLGVLIKVLRREPVQCVCLGTILKVPLTTIALVEDFGMAMLALILIFYA